VSRLRAARQSLARSSAAGANGSTAMVGDTTSGEVSGGAPGMIGAITSQLAVITALLYYLGWVRTYSFLSYFGIDPSMDGYGTVDYVLRSIGVAFPPFIRCAIIALMLFGVHRLIVAPALNRAEEGFTPRPTSAMQAQAISSPITSHPARTVVGRAMHRAWALTGLRTSPGGIRWCLTAVNAAGAALIVVVITAILLPRQIGAPLGIVLPLLLLAAVILLGYVTYLRSKYSVTLALAWSRQADPASRAYTLTLIALGLVAALWAVGLYGNEVGVSSAADLADNLLDKPSITIYSTERLAIFGPGVITAPITQAGTKYHYQYSGLRLLLHPPDKYILLPVGWRHGRDRVFVLRDDDTIRADLTAQ